MKEAVSGPKYPKIKLKLTGQNGNAFNIIGLGQCALKKAKVDEAEIVQFRKECMAGDYDNLLQTCMKWMEVR